MDQGATKIGGHLSQFTAKIAGTEIRVTRSHRYRPTVTVMSNGKYDYLTNSSYLFRCVRNWFMNNRLQMSKGIYLSLNLLNWKAGEFALDGFIWPSIYRFHSPSYPLLRRVFCDYAALRDQTSFMALKDLLIDQVPQFAKEMEQMQ
jgi:hypothetical protein